jgi:hypothetical protein
MDESNKIFTIKYVAGLMGKSTRTVQRYCDLCDTRKTKEGYKIYLHDVQAIGEAIYPEGDYPLALLEFLNAREVLHESRRNIALKASKEVRGVDRADKVDATEDKGIDAAIDAVTVYAARQGLVSKFYTEEEYAELKGQFERLKVVEENTAELKEQIAYLRESNKELTLMLKEGLISVQKALTTLSERNTIEAGDKGLLK